jgi:hypothetical protein
MRDDWFFGVWLLAAIATLIGLGGCYAYTEVTRGTYAAIRHANGTETELRGSVIYSEHDALRRDDPSKPGATTLVWPTDTWASMFAKGAIQGVPVVFEDNGCSRPAKPYRYIVEYDDSKLYLYPGDKLVLWRPCQLF